MADLNFPSMFDTRQAMDRQVTDDAYKAGNLPLGGGMMYAASLEGDLYGQAMQNLGGMLGGKPDPRVAKQQALDEIMKRFPDPRTPDEYMEVASALRSAGLHDYATQTVTLANEIRSSMPTQSSSTDYKDYLVDVDQGYTKTFADWRLEQEPNEDNRSTKEKTMDMAATFHQCAIDAGGWKKSNDECKAKVRKTYIQLNREDADEKGRGEGAKLEAKDISTTQTAIYTDSDNSRGSLATIDQSIGLLDQMYSGTGGESIKSFKSFLVSIGLADKDSNAQSEQFMRNSMQSITDWIQKTKGSISDKEMDAFVAASPNLYNTKAGNMLILQTMKEAAAYNIRLEKEWNRWIDEAKTSQRRTGFPPQMSDWRMNLEQWYRVNKVKLPTQTEIEKASKNSDSSSESTSSSISTSSSGLNYTVEKIPQ